MAEETRTMDSAAWAEGRRRALELLRDIESTAYEDLGTDPEWHEGRPQENVAHGHLVALITTQNKDVVESFSAVLTHYLGDVRHCGRPFWEEIEAKTLKPGPTRMAGLRARVALKPFGDVSAQFRIGVSHG